MMTKAQRAAAMQKQAQTKGYVPIHRNALVAALTSKAEELGMTEIALMQRLGVGKTLLSLLRSPRGQRYLSRAVVDKIVQFGIPAALFVRDTGARPRGKTRRTKRGKLRAVRPSLSPASHDQSSNGTTPHLDADPAQAQDVHAAFLLGRITEVIDAFARGVGVPASVLAVRVGELLRKPPRW